MSDLDKEKVRMPEIYWMRVCAYVNDLVNACYVYLIYDKGTVLRGN